MRITAICVVALTALPLQAQVLDKDAMLRRQTWLDNRDFAWFAARVPMFESPDAAIDATYYYRWELVTKHLVYGSPETGYTFTEFIDRPFWSGAYGAISCPLGHQLDEIRWLKDRRIIEDFSRYWLETPGAQSRSYSNWYGAAVWGTYEVLGDSALLRRLLPHMKRQYEGWMAERWDPKHRMFKWDGLHDGMERSITSRQTDDPDEGAVGFRPTLNTYLYADARAIARASALFGNHAAARDFDARADSLRRRVHEELWDPRREFFLHQFANDEKDGVKALSRTYETGKYAGDPHGRELLGYVPWQFNLPEQGKGYERAWRLLMDTAYFFAPFGPTTAERNDPQFYISPQCCWWSGNSWPYLTTQTLTAMANLLNHYRQDVVTPRDWMTLFGVYTRTQRKEGRPYIAEAANPDNGSWAGHDWPYHSEHYFHSAYANLVITGLVGLRPRADDTVEVNPLAPASWPYFALDDVSYHGRRLSVLWDRDGTRYRRGSGLMIFVDDSVVARAPAIGRLTAAIGRARPYPRERRLRNVAVNNGRGAYPWVEVSHAWPEHPPTYLVDGNYWYHRVPVNRWTTAGSTRRRDTVTVYLGAERRIERVTFHPLEDDVAFRRSGRTAVLPTGEIIIPALPPETVTLHVYRNGRWEAPRDQRRVPLRPEGRRANHISFAPLTASRVRLIVAPRDSGAVGFAELEVWSPDSTFTRANAAPRNLAHGAKVRASFTGQNDRVEAVNDGIVSFTRYSRNRWTALGTSSDSDWVELDLGALKRVSSVELFIYDDDRNTAPPRNYRVQVWTGRAWRNARERSRYPALPLASARNVVRLVPVTVSRIRVMFDHARPGVSGVTEIFVQ